MDMSEATPHIYETLADAGIDPVKARRIERAIIGEAIKSQSKTEQEFFDRVMTKEDGLQLELRLDKKLETLRADVVGKLNEQLARQNDQLRWYVGLMFIAVAASTAAVSLLHKLA